MKTVLVTGANGQLGRCLQDYVNENPHPEFQFLFMDRARLDVSKKEIVETFFFSNQIDFCINCAAYTAVDQAESDAENAFKANADAVKHLAEECNEQNAVLIHISTDYVFGNTKNTPIHPLDTDTVPSSIYGMTKLEGEENIKNSHSCYAIIRTAWLYSEFGTNFVKTMINVGGKSENVNVVYDQVGSPTYAVDLARAIMAMVGKLDSFTSETLHYTNEGVCSWYDFAKKIMELKKLKCTVNPIVSNQFPSPAPRPSYSVLDKQPIKDLLSITIPHWEDSLKECLKKL